MTLQPEGIDARDGNGPGRRGRGHRAARRRGLEYISSAGLGVLLKTHKRLLASSGKLRLTGVGPHLKDIFTYSGFDQLFEIVPGA